MSQFGHILSSSHFWHITITVDAPGYGLGAILSHVYKNGTQRPIAFAPRTLFRAEEHYPQIDKETIAIVFENKNFHDYLYGREFNLPTDRKPLAAIFGDKERYFNYGC